MRSANAIQAARPQAARPRAIAILLTGLSLLLSACVTLPRERFTAAEEAAATPVGFEKVRWVGDDPALTESLRRSLHPGPDGVLNALAISGGGANGAYGAGVITQWSRTGARPEFQVVTGGQHRGPGRALRLPGPRMERQAGGAPTSTTQVQHLLTRRGLLGLLTPGFYRKQPLDRLVSTYVTDDLIAAVAAEPRQGPPAARGHHQSRHRTDGGLGHGRHRRPRRTPRRAGCSPKSWSPRRASPWSSRPP